jgi:hypothetical protein
MKMNHNRQADTYVTKARIFSIFARSTPPNSIVDTSDQDEFRPRLLRGRDILGRSSKRAGRSLVSSRLSTNKCLVMVESARIFPLQMGTKGPGPQELGQTR